MNTAAQIFVRNLNTICEENSWSQSDFARATGLPQRTANNLFRCLDTEKYPNLSTLESIARALQISVADLVTPEFKEQAIDSDVRSVGNEIGRLIDDFIFVSRESQIRIIELARKARLENDGKNKQYR